MSKNTLVIGIDIAKHKHFACLVDDRGRELQKSFTIVQSRVGFEVFYERLLALKVAHEKQEILVGFEPTGHYWMNLATHFLYYFVSITDCAMFAAWSPTRSKLLIRSIKITPAEPLQTPLFKRAI